MHFLSDEFKEAQSTLGFPTSEWLGKSLTGNLEYLGSKNPEASVSMVSAVPKLYDAGVIDIYQSARILAKCSVDPFKAVEILSLIRKPDEEWPGELPSFIEAMVREDPEKAIETIVSDTSELPSSATTTAVRAWLQSDPAATQDWYNVNRSRLNQELRDQSAAAFAESALYHSDSESALAWTLEIEDVELQGKLQEAIKQNSPNP